MKSLKRYITFDDEGIKSNKMFITRDIDQGHSVGNIDILEFEKCMYTIVEDGLPNKDVMKDTFSRSKEWIYDNI